MPAWLTRSRLYREKSGRMRVTRALLVCCTAILGAEASTKELPTHYQSNASVFDNRRQWTNRLEATYVIDPRWSLSASTSLDQTRYDNNGYKSDSYLMAYSLRRDVFSWLNLSANLDLKKYVYKRQSRVDQDDQRCMVSAVLELGQGVRMTDSIGVFWFRTNDDRDLDGRTDRNTGFENLLEMSVQRQGLGARWNGSCKVESQFFADYPHNKLTASGGLEYPMPGLKLNLNASGSRQHDFPVSEALRGFEERTMSDRSVETTLNKPLMDGKVIAELSLSSETHRRDYTEQPNKNRLEGDDNLLGTMRFVPQDSLQFSLSVSRGFYRDVSSTIQGDKIDRRVERRSIDLNGEWKCLSWLEFSGRGKRSLHRTDHYASTATDDGDDLNDLYDISMEIRPTSKLDIQSEFKIDTRKERYLRAKWAPFSLDRSAYTLTSNGNYDLAPTLNFSSSITFLSTLTDYLYSREDSTFLLDRRIYSSISWMPRKWDLSLGAMIQFRTSGRLTRGTDGDPRIIPSKREVVSSLDFGCERDISESGTTGLSWKWRESAVEGFAPVPIHDVSFDLSMDIGPSRTITIEWNDRYHPTDPERRHLITMGVTIDAYF